MFNISQLLYTHFTLHTSHFDVYYNDDTNKRVLFIIIVVHFIIFHSNMAYDSVSVNKLQVHQNKCNKLTNKPIYTHRKYIA